MVSLRINTCAQVKAIFSVGEVDVKGGTALKANTRYLKMILKTIISAPLFAIWYIVVMTLPYHTQMKLGAALGNMVKNLSKKRRMIALTNIALCFPEMSPENRERLFDESMVSLGKGFMESGMAWFWPSHKLKTLCNIRGIEHLTQAKEDNHGVIFLAIHFTSIEICASCINTHISIDGFYRKHKNPLYEFIQRKGRTRRNCGSQVIPKCDTRGIVRALKNKRVVNYAADQDFGRNHSVFAPFFGISTATVAAPFTFARLGNAKIIPYTTKRLAADSGYEVVIYPPLEFEEAAAPVANLTKLNRFVEDRIRENPEQYLWVHRRFKTRPDGEKTFYACQSSADQPKHTSI